MVSCSWLQGMSCSAISIVPSVSCLPELLKGAKRIITRGVLFCLEWLWGSVVFLFHVAGFMQGTVATELLSLCADRYYAALKSPAKYQPHFLVPRIAASTALAPYNLQELSAMEI